MTKKLSAIDKAQLRIARELKKREAKERGIGKMRRAR